MNRDGSPGRAVPAACSRPLPSLSAEGAGHRAVSLDSRWGGRADRRFPPRSGALKARLAAHGRRTHRHEPEARPPTTTTPAQADKSSDAKAAAENGCRRTSWRTRSSLNSPASTATAPSSARRSSKPPLKTRVTGRRASSNAHRSPKRSPAPSAQSSATKRHSRTASLTRHASHSAYPPSTHASQPYKSKTKRSPPNSTQKRPRLRIQRPCKPSPTSSATPSLTATPTKPRHCCASS